MYPFLDCKFALADEEHHHCRGAYNVTAVLASVHLPAGCSYSIHSLRTGMYDELLGLGFPRSCITQHRNYDSEHMMRLTMIT
jgi:hypothetical protein